MLLLASLLFKRENRVQSAFRECRITCRAIMISSLFARYRLIAGGVNARSNFTLVFLSRFIIAERESDV